MGGKKKKAKTKGFKDKSLTARGEIRKKKKRINITEKKVDKEWVDASVRQTRHIGKISGNAQPTSATQRNTNPHTNPHADTQTRPPFRRLSSFLSCVQTNCTRRGLNNYKLSSQKLAYYVSQ